MITFPPASCVVPDFTAASAAADAQALIEHTSVFLDPDAITGDLLDDLIDRLLPCKLRRLTGSQSQSQDDQRVDWWTSDDDVEILSDALECVFAAVHGLRRKHERPVHILPRRLASQTSDSNK